MKKTVIVYNLFLSSIITLVGVINAKNASQLAVSLAFLPVAIYFVMQLVKRSPQGVVGYKTFAITKEDRLRLARSKTANHSSHKNDFTIDQGIIEPEVLSAKRQEKAMERMGIADANRRVFLKFIGTSSISLFLLALFTKRAQAAFFGSNPGPGIVAIKDSTGNTINPAEKQSTDGYEVSEIDDTTTTTYYGFTNKESAWYITQESSTGSYRYVKGASGFAANWANRATLTYDTFDNVF